MTHRMHVFLIAFALGASVCRFACAESQGNDYRGITDPFGDPSNYEFADDEKEDKEFFHLGRYLMVGFDVGVGIFTGGLGRSVNPGFYAGLKLQYFFDRSLCLEIAGHFASHTDVVITKDGTAELDLDTQLIPVTLGFRYYFDTRSAPKAIAIANPYLALGGGLYMRSLSVLSNPQNITTPQTGTTNAFGGYGGAGVEFSIYRRHVYLGLDLRYHMIFFPDKDDTLGGKLEPGDRSGDYFTAALSLSYNF